MLALLTVAAPILLLRRGRHYLPTLRGRLGRSSSPVATGPRLWIHAVSVGEAGVAATLIRALPPAVPLVLTTITPTGQAVARRSLGDGRVAYLPFDLGFPIRRFLDTWTPSALVLIEGDLWPLLLSRVKRRGLPVVVVNGRVSDRGLARLRRLGRFTKPILLPVDLYGVQTDRDRERLIALGVPPERVRVTGNLKFESAEPPELPALESAVRALAAGRPILVAGSTMDGEEAALLDAFAAVGDGRALLVLAPRHPERTDGVYDLIGARGLNGVRRSGLPIGPDEERGGSARIGVGGSGRIDVLLLDTMGELASLYRLAAGVFIGGTLVSTGGHNPLEAARFGAPIAVGPSMHNFAEVAERFDARAAWRRVDDGRQLGAVWNEWLADAAAARALGARAEALLAENRGALERTLALLREAMPAVVAADAASDPVAPHGVGER